jgi:hypothetical protein
VQIIARALVAEQQAEEARETAPAVKQQVRTGARKRKARKPQQATAQPLPAAE